MTNSKCRWCEERPIAFGQTCRSCYDRERYQSSAAVGFCVRCRKYRTRHTHVLCPSCLTKQRANTTALRLDRREKGLCECGRKRVRGLMSCQACRTRKADDLRRRRLVAKDRREIGGWRNHSVGG